MQIINYVQSSWVFWLFIALFSLIGCCYRFVLKRVDKQLEQHHAVLQGIKILLKQRIIDAHMNYTSYGFCPLYAKESIAEIYHAYHELCGDDVITELFEEVLELPVKGEYSL
jgi:hypothetical protein